jgi:hypothetical protein
MKNTTDRSDDYGDEKLRETFVWGKKLQKNGLSNVSAKHLEAMTAQRIKENKVKLFLSL